MNPIKKSIYFTILSMASAYVLAEVQQPQRPAAAATKNSAASKPDKPQLIMLDRIEAVLFGSESTEIVTLSDINRASFDGKIRSKQDVILERLLFQDALRHRIMIDEKTIDDYIDKMRKSYNASLDDIKLMFEQAGYTFDEGRRQLGVMYGSNQMIDFKIRSRLIIPEKDVQAFFDENPIIQPGRYTIERAFIPARSEKKEEIKSKLKDRIAAGKDLGVPWYQLPEITENELAENKKFITKLAVGAISEPQEINDGFELYKLVNKHEATLVPLEVRYRDIVDILRKPKFDEQLEEYKKNLLTSASIVYF